MDKRRIFRAKNPAETGLHYVRSQDKTPYRPSTSFIRFALIRISMVVGNKLPPHLAATQ